MSSTRSKDRLSDCTCTCTFTFADGRRCRMPRKSGHPFLCCFHARKEAQAQAAEEVGRDIRFFLSGDYLSAGDLSLALGRVFAAAARGNLKPKTAGTLAYLGQTLLQTIHLAENEYINAFSTDRWRRVIHTHINENSNYLFPPPPPAPPQAPAHVEAGLKPGLSDRCGPSTGRDLSPAHEPGVPKRADVSAARTSSTTDADLIQSASLVSQSAAGADVPAVASPSPAPKRLPPNAAKFASTVLSSTRSCQQPPARTQTDLAKSVPAPEPASPTGPSGAPLLAALPPRNPTPKPARPSDSALSQTPR